MKSALPLIALAKGMKFIAELIYRGTIIKLVWNTLNKPAAQAAGADPSWRNQPIGNVHPFRKSTVTFDPMVKYW